VDGRRTGTHGRVRVAAEQLPVLQRRPPRHHHLLLGSESGVDQLDDWREAGFDPRITATFELLEKVTLSPGTVTAADAAAVRAAGLSDEAIADALYVCFLFNTINRIANAMDFRWNTDTDRMRLAAGLNRIRYQIPEFLLH
jgi:hypothetical protein